MTMSAKRLGEREAAQHRAFKALLAEVMSPEATPGWWHRAACRDASDPDVFFRDEGDKIANRLFNIRVVETYCATCPVSSQCLTEALAMETHRHRDLRFGIFGGTTPFVRVRLDRAGAA